MQAVVGFHSPIGGEDSYSYLECRQWASVLGATVSRNYVPAEKTFLYLGNNYESGEKEKAQPLSLFGGLTEKNYRMLESFVLSKSDFVSIGYRIPEASLDSFIQRSQTMTDSTFHGVKLDVCEAVKEKAMKINCITTEDLVTDSIMIGDSHSYSMAPVGVPTKKLRAQTLNGSIKRDQFKEWGKTKAKNMYFMLGSVDIQFHIFRQSDPWYAIDQLADRYLEQAEYLESMGKKVWLCSPVPVVGEDRKLTPTTSYKGQFFYGSVEDRTKATLRFIDRLSKSTDVICYPDHWYTEPRHVYHQKLERARGHHLKFQFSRMNDFNKGQELDFF